jgi:hypothetical protein
MERTTTLKMMSVSTSLAVLLGVSACKRGDEPQSMADRQTQTARPANQPVTISGCLKAGDAEDTFVLTAARSEGSTETATYQLAGSPGVNLRDHIGQRVEVNGTMNAQQEIASSTSAVGRDEDRPAGTSGKPRVETKAELEVNRLSVSAVKPLGDRCEM